MRASGPRVNSRWTLARVLNAECGLERSGTAQSISGESSRELG